MATRTAKGTAKLKANGTTLTLVSVTLAAGEALVVMVGNQTTNIPINVKWGAKELSRAANQSNGTSGHSVSIWTIRNVVLGDTRDIVVTWDTAIGARVLAASSLDFAHIRDENATSIQTASTAPSVGPTASLAQGDEFAFGVLVSQGPNSDIAPSLSGFTSGQRDGNVGVPPASNITILEGFAQLSDSSAITLSGTGATERDWVSALVAYRPIAIIPALDSSGTKILIGGYC